ncbi:DNA polymerase III subunit delta [Mesoplasma photuris]|uniref:DNA polymerase III subunit delta n=1 Tax=Mesoplasma photuris TaxID=217731 RepID=UPI00068C7F48|nr:hypothetical protein [Mesoplasma photuris]
MRFIYSVDSFLLKKAVGKLIKQINFNDQYEVIELSLIDDDFNMIIETVNSMSLFNEPKIVVIKDAYFVNEQKITLHKNFSESKLNEYILKNKSNNEVIFTLNSDKFSKKLKLAKYIQEVCEVQNIPPLDEPQIIKYIETLFKRENKIIDQSIIKVVMNNLPLDLQIITNEVIKLSAISNELTEQVVLDNITKYVENDIFAISDAFIKNDIDRFLKLYKDFILLNDEQIGLLNLMNANISFMRDVKILYQQGKTMAVIAEKLSANPYRVKLAINANDIKIRQLNDKIKLLYKIQTEIMNGKMDQKVMPEYQFIRNMRETWNQLKYMNK